MFLSMVKAPSEKRRLTALTATQYVQRYNVAASRAKDQMWVYHSVAQDDLTNPEDMRYQLLDYCYGVVNRTRREDDGTKLDIVPEDVLVAPFDSLFEQRVYNRIVDRGYTVHPQYPAQGYNIDMVIIGAKGKLAVECDGDFWHGAAAYDADLARQRELERCGWEFFRIRESMFYADMAGSLAKLWSTLDELDIRTADWIDPSFGEDVADETVEVIEDVVVDDATAAARDGSSQPVSSADDTAIGARLNELPGDHDDDHDYGDAGGTENAVSEQFSTQDLPKLQPYVTFNESLPGIAESRLDTVSTNIARIVAAEGPVLGERLHQAYAKAAGTQVVGKKVAHILNQAITSAERRGMIISDNPLGEAGVKPRTFRCAAQPEFVARELGPRPLGLVPPAELAHHLFELSAGSGDRTEDEIFDEVRRRFGLERLNENARAALERALTLVPLDACVSAPSMS